MISLKHTQIAGGGSSKKHCMAFTRSEEFRNTPKVLKNLKHYWHIFFQKRNCKSLSRLWQRKIGSAWHTKHKITSGINFFWVAGPSLHPDAYLGVCWWEWRQSWGEDTTNRDEKVSLLSEDGNDFGSDTEKSHHWNNNWWKRWCVLGDI